MRKVFGVFIVTVTTLFLIAYAVNLHQQAADKKEALAQFEKLQAALSDCGIDICLDDTYRSEDGQTVRWEFYEHDGEVVQIEPELISEVYNMMPQFGFTLYHPKGEEDTTEYADPYVIQYVGDPEVAREVIKTHKAP